MNRINRAVVHKALDQVKNNDKKAIGTLLGLIVNLLIEIHDAIIDLRQDVRNI